MQNIKDASSEGSHFQPLQACRKFELSSGMEMLTESLRGLIVGGKEFVGFFFFWLFFYYYFFPVTFRCGEAAVAVRGSPARPVRCGSAAGRKS